MSIDFYDINKIPKDWKSSKLKYILKFSELTSNNYELEKNLSLTQTGIIEKDINSNEGQIAKDYKKYILIKKGQICMNPMDLLSGWADISSSDGLISPAYYTLIPSNNFDVKFINYFLQSNYYRETFFTLGKGVASHDNFGRWVLTPDEFKNIVIFYPSIEKQKKISSFLDKKINEINLLIQFLIKKISLLKEQKVSVLNEIITKGINTDIELKDTNINFIGKIPKHWSVAKLKWLIHSIKDGTHGTHQSTNEGVHLLSSKNVLDGKLKIKKNERMISLTEHNNITRNGYPSKGDVLVTSVGSIGRSCVFENEKPISFQRSVCFIRPSNKIDSYFLSFMMRSYVSQTQMIGLTNQATVGGLYMNDIIDILIPYPTIEEQKLIVTKLNKKINNIDLLIENEEAKIKYLEEYKGTIISCAIQGILNI